MKKALALVLAIALTAAIAVGGTLAYLTDTDEDVNVMTIGKVKIDQLEFERIDTETADQNATVQEFHDNKPLLPAVVDKEFDWETGDSYVDWEQIGKDGYTSDIWDPSKINNEVDKMVFVKNKGDYDAYVRSVFAFEAGKYTTLDEFQKMVHLNLNTTDYSWEWVKTPVAIPNEEGGTETTNYFVAVATYKKVLEPGALTEISLSQIALDKTATNADVEAFGETYQVLVKTQGIQVAGFDNAEDALDEGFGVIAADNIPWENDAATKGTDLKTAVRYLNADGATEITTKVNSVIFGLNKDYVEIVNSNEGILIDVEQDVPVYAYYLDNGTGYDIYVLANDTIYAPKDSSSLFEDMSEIVTMDVENLDVSRVENATRMFRNCKKLQKLDVADWDVSNMKTMERLFVNCYALENVDVSKWDTSNNTDFCMVFYGCKAMDKVDVSQWDTSKGTLFNSMFAYSPKFNLDREALKNWDMSSAVRINHMFYGCNAQEELDLSGWDMPNMITTTHMFADCNSLRSVDFTGWNTPSLVSMDAMFNDCNSLTYLDMSSFDTANCNEFSQVFERCSSLTKIDGLDKWDTGNARTYEELFYGCAALKEVDLSTFYSRDVVNDYAMEWKGTGWGFLRMFAGMNSLEKMTLSADFSFDGDGKVTTESYKVSLPSPAAKEGYTAKWRNVETGELYLASEIPEEVAATYEAYYEAIPTT